MKIYTGSSDSEKKTPNWDDARSAAVPSSKIKGREANASLPFFVLTVSLVTATAPFFGPVAIESCAGWHSICWN